MACENEIKKLKIEINKLRPNESTSRTEDKKNTSIFLELFHIEHENYTELEISIKIPKNNLLKIT